MKFEYTAVVRTLGTAGDKYQQLLNSLDNQSLPPSEIIIYIADGYPLPKETIGKERYVHVRKGMLTQRALNYDDVNTEYILFLDDDLMLSTDEVQKMYDYLNIYNADVIAPDIFSNAGRSFTSEVMMTLSGRMMPRRDDGCWGYKVMKNSGYSYNKHPRKSVYRSQTNAGACFLCKKEDFLKAQINQELWVDDVKYPQGEDQVMYYKMHLRGLKVITYYDHSIKHLDGGNNMSAEKERTLVYSDFRFKTIFWHRFILKPERRLLSKIYCCLAMGYTISFAFLVSLIKCRFDIIKIKYTAIKDAVKFIKSNEYRSLPLI